MVKLKGHTGSLSRYCVIICFHAQTSGINVCWFVKFASTSTPAAPPPGHPAYIWLGSAANTRSYNRRWSWSSNCCGGRWQGTQADRPCPWVCETGLKMVEGLLWQETPAPGLNCRQLGATVDLLPAYAWRQEAGATLDWSFLYGSLCGGGSIPVRVSS